MLFKGETSLKKLREFTDFLGYEMFSCGYCELHGILNREPRLTYNSGVYGWNWDAYQIYGSDGRGVVIITGYRNLGSKSMRAPYELVRDVEAQAENLDRAMYDRLITWDECDNAKDALTTSLADKLLKIRDNEKALDII